MRSLRLQTRRCAGAIGQFDACAGDALGRERRRLPAGRLLGNAHGQYVAMKFVCFTVR